MRKFDTCFFERYAQISLENLVDKNFAALLNEDRPDLQMEDKSIGIEVTRAMESSKEVAQAMLKEMAGIELAEENNPDHPDEDLEKIKSSGYGYGLHEGKYIGHLEYEYWALAQPLKRIIASKVEKVGSGFYGDFKEFALYIFCKDQLDTYDIESTVAYILELQNNLDIRYSTLYLSEIDKLHICTLTNASSPILEIQDLITTKEITQGQRRAFFFSAL